ncbi:MAG TPA: response regulator [Candidatus Binatia bacterium]
MSLGSVLAVDDEELNLLIISEALEEADFDVVTVANGTAAITLLEAQPERFETVLLDRMLPDISGMEVLARMKSNATLAQLPVILQTACAGKEDIIEGFQGGAYYYLSKPFDFPAVVTVVKTAVEDYRRYQAMRQLMTNSVKAFGLLVNGSFSFANLAEAQDLAACLANVANREGRLAIGLGELFVNAVEHGNVGITYEEKSQLNARGGWEAEVNRRLALPEHCNKKVAVSFERCGDEAKFLIRDEGAGFEWKKYLEIDTDRVFDSHGRGIAMARLVSFDHVEYHGCGNEVLAVAKCTN